MDQAYLLAIKIYKLLSNLENVLPSSSTFKANASPTQHPTLNTLSLAIESIVSFDELTIRFPLRFAVRFDSLCFQFFLLWSNISAGHDNVNGPPPFLHFVLRPSSKNVSQVFLLHLLH